MTKYTEKDVSIIIEFYPSLYSKDLMKLVPNHTWTSIKDKAGKLGLSRPNIRINQLNSLLKETLINCYWWGFIMADGYISSNGTLKITLSSKDEKHLEKLKEYLKLNKIYKYKNNLVAIDVTDRINGLKLRDILNLSEKAKTFNPPSSLDFLNDENMFLSFLIGFIDGDGSLTFNENNIFKSIRIEIHKSWIEILKEISEKLNKYFDIQCNVKINNHKSGYAQLYFGKKNSYELIKNFILKNKIPALNRKWRLYENSN